MAKAPSTLAACRKGGARCLQQFGIDSAAQVDKLAWGQLPLTADTKISWEADDERSASFTYLCGSNWNRGSQHVAERAAESEQGAGLHEGKRLQGRIAKILQDLQRWYRPLCALDLR